MGLETLQTGVRDVRSRLRVLSYFNAIVLSVLLVRTGYLQLLKGSEYREKSRMYSEQIFLIPAIRGEILDRKGQRLVVNRGSFALNVLPLAVPEEELEPYAERVARVLSVESSNIVRTIRAGYEFPYDRVVIADGLAFEDVVRCAENNLFLPGADVECLTRRVFPEDGFLCHVLGYTGPISKAEMRELYELGYHPRDVIGKYGVEKMYDIELRGVKGIRKRVRDALLRARGKEEEVKAPIPGNDLVLTIDSDLQRAAETALGKRRGCVIVTRPTTGEILALVSYPGFDANLFVAEKGRERLVEILSDESYPFVNRAIGGQYPASSGFKPVTAIAALEERKISPHRRFECAGGLFLGDRYFKCWSWHGHQNMYGAIQRSCNCYFYQLGFEIGSELIRQYARRLGFGEKTGIDLPGEMTGRLPTIEWKKKRFREGWWDGDTYNLAIGQGFLEVTPLQVNCLYCAIVNGGTVYRPKVVREVRSAVTGEVRRPFRREVFKDHPLDRQTLDVVRRSLRLVVTHGTARYGAWAPGLRIAGKTGTAENVLGPYPHKPHSWFSGYAPANAPPDERVVITAMCENAGEGADVATPVAVAVLRSYFLGEDVEEALRDVRKHVEERRARLRRRREEMLLQDIEE